MQKGGDACAEGDGCACAAARAAPRLPRQERLVSRARARRIREGCHPLIKAQIVQQCSPAHESAAIVLLASPHRLLRHLWPLPGDRCKGVHLA